ncbi:hypothetical protein GDI0149 [Gluconacetobacter diazotrophicus PA1 5]|uniref:Uncharacterized protein n=1 Tax=Gluconacetobacter diazotrophicus (strain ATCC 49037 / DSM 5601 / CCUG 37298 / CIP 103539 / LMG 7603 / PAl5) TaxID=272568 RepID=A9H228_GLUDA|nr:hypothetical protein GDI0149 [Gluconacetobacter diazotrophicus PA1 5]
MAVCQPDLLRFVPQGHGQQPGDFPRPSWSVLIDYRSNTHPQSDLPLLRDSNAHFKSIYAVSESFLGPILGSHQETDRVILWVIIPPIHCEISGEMHVIRLKSSPIRGAIIYHAGACGVCFAKPTQD